MNIGAKIKNLRKQKGISQSELSGSVITRNMLSQIETGKAMPSLATLIYISSVLDTPIEYLVSDKEDAFPFLKNNAIDKIKKEFKIGIAFGSGGAKGVAHLGALKAFEEEGISFDIIAGTSIGSIVGALYAKGYSSDDMRSLLEEVVVSDMQTVLMLA